MVVATPQDAPDLTPAPEKARNRSTKSRCTIASLFERPREPRQHTDGGEALLDRHSPVVGIEFFELLVAKASQTRPGNPATTRRALGEAWAKPVSSINS